MLELNLNGWAPYQGAVLGRRDGWRVAEAPLWGGKSYVQLIGAVVSLQVTGGGDFAERALTH